MQGISEFLPVSSSAHLVLFSRIFGYPDQGLVIDVAVHGGSLFAVMIYFRRRIYELLGGLYDMTQLVVSDRARLVVFLIIATLPLLPVGYFLSGEGGLRYPLLIGFATIFFAIMLWYAERYGQAVVEFEPFHWKTALFVGVMQCFALIPGTSRSGVVITACLFAGMRRREAIEIAMLLSIPAILAAVTLLGSRVIASGDALITEAALTAAGASFICAYLAISLLMRFIDKIGFMPFILYRMALGCWMIWLFRDITP